MGRLADRLAEGLAGLEHTKLLRRRRLLDSPQGARIVVDGNKPSTSPATDYLGLAHHPQPRGAAHARSTRSDRRGRLATGDRADAHPCRAALRALSGLPRALPRALPRWVLPRSATGMPGVRRPLEPRVPE
jgi:8-amino-7-oxononanoate synthase